MARNETKYVHSFLSERAARNSDEQIALGILDPWS
jgi:hypothetical protein